MYMFCFMFPVDTLFCVCASVIGDAPFGTSAITVNVLRKFLLWCELSKVINNFEIFLI